jgi:hypothetical protein
MIARSVAIIACVAACSVPELPLDGKQCPCIEVGYVCDTVTNRCLATNDGGMIIDTPSATSCLPTVAEVEIYRYAGTFDWQHADSSWMGGAEITQSSSNAQDTYTYKTTAELTAAKDVHVISSMRQIRGGSGEPALGIVLRAQLSTQDKSRYACMWSPKTRNLFLDVSQGGNAMRLTEVEVQSPSPPTSFTMEASVTGSTLACCIREIPGASITGVMNGSVTSGYPGLQTKRMEAAFGSFVVYRP